MITLRQRERDGFPSWSRSFNVFTTWSQPKWWLGFPSRSRVFNAITTWSQYKWFFWAVTRLCCHYYLHWLMCIVSLRLWPCCDNVETTWTRRFSLMCIVIYRWVVCCVVLREFDALWSRICTVILPCEEGVLCFHSKSVILLYEALWTTVMLSNVK